MRPAPSPVVLFAFAAALLLSGCASSRPEPMPDVSAGELETLRAELDAAYADLEAARAREAELRRALDMQGDNGERGETVAVLSSDIFFESGSAELTPEGAAQLVDVARRLRDDFGGRTIRVEGSTDGNPIGPNLQAQYPSNWELSAARAATVARHLQWTHDFSGEAMEVVGLGEYHPIGSNETAEGRQENRRVRIAVLMD